MSKQAFEQKVREIEQLSLEPGPETTRRLRKALANRNNYLVSKTAGVAASLHLDELIPDLSAAFERFLEDPVKSDPQCWAKIAIVKALKDLGHREPDVFLRGIQHIQQEPVWGGRQDTAGPLRSACALALVDCRLGDLEVLTRLGDLLADHEPPVRGDAALAIAQLGRPEGVPLLRLKALSGDTEPDVVGQCLASVLNLDVSDAVAFVTRFLDHADLELRVEAAAALGGARDPQAVETLVARYRRERDFELRRAIVTSLGASPVRAAAEFLLAVIGEVDEELARTALMAVAASRFRNEYREQVEAIMKSCGNPALKRAFAQGFEVDE